MMHEEQWGELLSNVRRQGASLDWLTMHDGWIGRNAGHFRWVVCKLFQSIQTVSVYQQCCVDLSDQGWPWWTNEVMFWWQMVCVRLSEEKCALIFVG